MVHRVKSKCDKSMLPEHTFKFENITADISLQESDVLVLAETWIQEKTDMCNKFKLQKYETHLNCSGRGKGLAIFKKPEFKHIADHNQKDINITKIESDDLDVIAIYRSKEGSLSKLISKLHDIINMSKSTLIIGDMNICNKKMATNDLRKYLEDRKFKQVINRATHIEGGHLNHAYIMNKGNFVESPGIELIPKYYSDHDSICVAWRKIEPKVREIPEKAKLQKKTGKGEEWTKVP